MRVVPSRIRAGTSVWTVTSLMGSMRPPFAFRLLSGASAEKHEGCRSQEHQHGGHGEGERADRPYPAPHLCCVVHTRERFVRHLDAEELAEWTPALLHLVDQQPVLWDAPPDLFVVAVEDLYRVAAFLEASVKGTVPDDLIRHVASHGRAENKEADDREADPVEAGAGDANAQLVDGVLRAVVPLLGVPYAQQYFRI